MALVTVFQVKADLTRYHAFMGLDFMVENCKQDPKAYDMKAYEVVFGELQTEGVMFFYERGTRWEDNMALLNKLFAITNDPSRANEGKSLVEHFNFKGRSISVSDIIQIDDTFYYCDSFGWKEIGVKNAPHWIYEGMGASGTYYTDLTPFEVIKVTPSGKTVTIRRMDTKPAEGHDHFADQRYIYASNPKNSTETVRRTKYGTWKTPSGMRVNFGDMRKYQDPHF